MARQLEIDAPIPEKLMPLWDDWWRWFVAYGGRGAAKSRSVARVLLCKATQREARWLCAREFQKSVDESVKALLEHELERLRIRHLWVVRDTYLYCPRTNSEFIFEGLHLNVNGIKSLEGLDGAWVEEAEGVTHKSWEVLIPTVRKKGSQIIVTFNTGDEKDETYRRLVLNPPPRSVVVKVNYYHNPWFMETELNDERLYLKRVDPDAYANVWLGLPRKRSASQVLNGKWRIGTDAEFTDIEQLIGNNPMYGADWGFAADPTTLVRCRLVGARLYITHEIYRNKLENNDITMEFLKVPGAGTHVIRGDSARPETIAYLNRGQEETLTRPAVPPLMVEGVEKGPGSVEEGVAFLRGLEEIIIHPRCVHAIEEARMWSYKVDKKTNDIQPELEDGNDHIWDGVRYALQPIIKTSNRNDGMIRYLQQIAAEKAAQERAEEED